MGQSNESPLDKYKEEILDLRAEGYNKSEIAAFLLRHYDVETSRKSVDRAFKRWGASDEVPVQAKPGVRLTGDSGEVASKPSTTLSTPEELLRERGLDPAEWEVVSATINEWDSPSGVTLKQLKANIKRVKPLQLVFPAREPGAYVAPKIDRVPNIDRMLVVLVGDQQAPYHDTNLHRLFCQWLRHNEPEEGVLLGDTMDFPTVSRHPDNPEWAANTQACIDAAYALLQDYVRANGKTSWQLLAGNHDERIRRVLIDKTPDLYGLKRACSDDVVYSIRHLLWLDKLGIDYIDPQGDYEHAQVKLSQHLAARHGWIAIKGSGNSALKTLDHLGFSVVVGHTHRQGLVHVTKHDIDGRVKEVLKAVETGCMCRIEDGLGYAVAPDWQNGFATAEIWPDGTFNLELATYIDGTLYWRNQRYV